MVCSLMLMMLLTGIQEVLGVGPGYTVLGYQLLNLPFPRRKGMKINGLSSPREARQEVDILSRGRQRLPLYHKSFGIRMPVLDQGIQ
jgi:hypothetical protein